MASKLPHFKVCTRLAPSKIHGVGVVAIRPIQKGVQIFFGDDDKLTWIKRNKLKNLHKELMKLYKDFCIKKGSMYGCPKNFNQMTPAWYLNHSSNPNVASDRSYRFFALRNIRKGEELTVDYETYSEKEGRRLTSGSS